MDEVKTTGKPSVPMCHLLVMSQRNIPEGKLFVHFEEIMDFSSLEQVGLVELII